MHPISCKLIFISEEPSSLLDLHIRRPYIRSTSIFENLHFRRPGDPISARPHTSISGDPISDGPISAWHPYPETLDWRPHIRSISISSNSISSRGLHLPQAYLHLYIIVSTNIRIWDRSMVDLDSDPFSWIRLDSVHPDSTRNLWVVFPIRHGTYVLYPNVIST